MASKKTEDVDGADQSGAKKAAAKKAAPAKQAAATKPATDEKPAGEKAMEFTEESEKALNTRLQSFIDRIERLEEEKKALGDDIKEIYSEAKGTGYDSKIIRKIVQIRKMDANKRKEEEALLETYMAELGMI